MPAASALNAQEDAAPRRLAAASSIWLPTGPARWSGLQVQRPRLIVFYHVEKTGGTAVMKYLHKMANNKSSSNPARLTSLMDFTKVVGKMT